jgi:putative holliday junction resolvase
MRELEARKKTKSENELTAYRRMESDNPRVTRRDSCVWNTSRPGPCRVEGTARRFVDRTLRRAARVTATSTIGAALKVLALDYGSARTGVAVSDPTGTVARPLEVVEGATTEAGLARLVELARREGVERIVVGLPVTLRGERGSQAEETERFTARLRAATGLPVESFDERFTTALARSAEAKAAEDALAAAHLLTSYLQWQSGRPA